MFQLSATPAIYRPDGFEFQPLDPDKIVKRTSATTMHEMREALDAFVEELPGTKSFIVFGHWPRIAGKPPRGFKAACDRNEFTRHVKREHTRTGD